MSFRSGVSERGRSGPEALKLPSDAPDTEVGGGDGTHPPMMALGIEAKLVRETSISRVGSASREATRRIISGLGKPFQGLMLNPTPATVACETTSTARLDIAAIVQQKRDQLMARLACAQLIVAWCGVALMIALYTQGWDSDDFEFRVGVAGNALKIAIWVTTMFLLFLVWRGYRIWYGPIASSRRFWLAGNGRFQLLGEFALCLLQPIPFWEPKDWRIGLLMFVRIYLVVPLFVYHSTVFRRRVFDDKGYRRRSGAFYLKAVFHKYSVEVTLGTLLFCFLCYGFAVFVQEREGDEWREEEGLGTFRYDDSIWFIYITMTTIGYGDRVPTSDGGRIIAAIAGVSGLVVSSLLIANITNTLALSQHHQVAFDTIQQKKEEETERALAARVVQHAWRFFVWRKKSLREGSAELSEPEPVGSPRERCVSKADRSLYDQFRRNLRDATTKLRIHMEGRDEASEEPRHDPILTRLMDIQSQLFSVQRRLDMVESVSKRSYVLNELLLESMGIPVPVPASQSASRKATVRDLQDLRDLRDLRDPITFRVGGQSTSATPSDSPSPVLPGHMRLPLDSLSLGPRAASEGSTNNNETHP